MASGTWLRGCDNLLNMACQAEKMHSLPHYYSRSIIELTSSGKMTVLSGARCPSAKIVFKLPLVIH